MIRTDHRLSQAQQQALEYLVSDCLPVLKFIPPTFDPPDIEALKIRACPSRIANLVAAQEVALRLNFLRFSGELTGD